MATEISKEVLLQASHLHYGIICQAYEEAIDLIIPVFFWSEERQYPTRKNISGPFCQVKNWKAPWSPSDQQKCIESIGTRVQVEFGIAQPHMQILMRGHGRHGGTEEERKARDTGDANDRWGRGIRAVISVAGPLGTV